MAVSSCPVEIIDNASEVKMIGTALFTGAVNATAQVTGVGAKLAAVTAGALSTASLSSTTGAQLSTARDVDSVTALTLTPTGAAAATVLVELSPDNSTYSTLLTITDPISGPVVIIPLTVHVPAGWYLRLTTTNSTIGTTTYW